MENSNKDGKKRRVHNLIVLDESGSMQSIYNAALTGVNETLQTIRNGQKENPDQEHFVSLITFDSTRYNRIYRNMPADRAMDITKEQYSPNACTPLYDAMGRSINELRDRVEKEDVVLVTIITDGYENASHEYSGAAIKSMVEKMRSEGWVFTYIGANQDVEAVASSLAINNRLRFTADDDGTREMFVKESKARRNFYSKLSEEYPSYADNYFDA